MEPNLLVLSRDPKNCDVRLTDRATGKLLGVVSLVEARSGGRVRIGFDFSPDVNICRGEIAERYEATVALEQ